MRALTFICPDVRVEPPKLLEIPLTLHTTSLILSLLGDTGQYNLVLQDNFFARAVQL